jgi:glycosyltransferase involved in cell wall biosynthesis
MRVLMISQEMPPETGWGGIGTYVDILSEALAGRGHEVHVLSVVHGQAASTTRRHGVVVHRYNVPRIPGPTRLLEESWRRILLALSVAALVRRLALGPDVIECPEWMAEGLLLGLSEAVPLVVRLHSSARQIFPFHGQGQGCRGLDGKLAMWLEDVSARRAHVVVSTRSNLHEVAGPLGLDPRALHAIPYPVRLSDPTPIEQGSRPRVAFVGRLEPRKGPDVLIRAAPRVLEAIPDAEFTFVGRDVMPPGKRPSSAWLEQEAERLGVAHALRFTGELQREGVQAELRQATVCAFPSAWESFGLVVGEASAVGRPVVATPIPPFQDLVQDGVTGRLVEREDVEGWTEALIELLRDRSLAWRMGEAGARHVAALSAPDRVADLALAAYEDARRRWLRRLRAGRHVGEPAPTASHPQPNAPLSPGSSAPAEVSVIMCVHNGAGTITDQLAALAAQDYSGPWELLVVDNLSTDRTREIVEALAGRVPSLRVIEANDRLGLAYARNVGAKAAHGQVLAFCDADDVADPGWLSALVEGMGRADLVGGALELELLNSGLAQYWRGMFPERLDWPYLGYLPYVVGANFAVRREAFEAVDGCDERFITCGDDVDLAWRIQRAGGRLVFSPGPVMHYRLREDLRGVMRQRYRYGMVEALLRRKYSDSVPPLDWRLRLHSIRRLLYRSWHLLAGPYRRGGWLAHASNLAGQLRGSLRYRVMA